MVEVGAEVEADLAEAERVTKACTGGLPGLCPQPPPLRLALCRPPSDLFRIWGGGCQIGWGSGWGDCLHPIRPQGRGLRALPVLGGHLDIFHPDLDINVQYQSS